MHGGGILWIPAVGSNWRVVVWFAVQLAWAVADCVVRCRAV